MLGRIQKVLRVLGAEIEQLVVDLGVIHVKDEGENLLLTQEGFEVGSEGEWIDSGTEGTGKGVRFSHSEEDEVSWVERLFK